jgi:ferric-dicitrate binding protein FerR (iron transport regulator)
MNDSNTENWELLAKYLSDEISEEEKNTLFTWINESPANKELFYRTTHLWQVTGKDKSRFIPQIDQAWHKFQAAIQSTESNHTKNEHAYKIRKAKEDKEVKVIPLRPVRKLMQIAAAMLVMIGLAYVAFFYSASSNKVLTFRAEGTKTLLVLPDSSRVLLNKNSTLSYSRDFEGTIRQVNLAGEAFFEVKRMETKPFVIFTDQSRTEVLGTSFSVRAYPQEGQTEVQVVTGRVAFSGRSNSDSLKVILTPGFKGWLSKQNKLQRTKIDDLNYLAWKEDQLEFNNTQLEFVVASLERYFGVSIAVENPDLLTCRFTGSFQHPELKEMLEVLAISTNLKYQFVQGRYVLTGSGCQ